MGFETKPYVQVSMNLTNYKGTPMHMVVDTVRNEAARYGVSIIETEVYGMIPVDALLEASEHYLQLNEKWDRSQIIEKKMESIESDKSLENLSVADFLSELASDSPAPGGGSASCVSGAMGAGLAAMVLRLTIGKKGYEEHEQLFSEKLSQLDSNYKKLTNLINKDANAFNGVIAAFKLPKENEEDKKKRALKIQEEYKKAASIPMETVKTCKSVLDIIFEIGTKGNKNAMSDIAVAALNTLTGLKGAAYNVEINLPSIKDQEFVSKMKKELSTIMEGLDKKVSKLIEEARSKF